MKKMKKCSRDTLYVFDEHIYQKAKSCDENDKMAIGARAHNFT